jgi:hypothetical protein
VDVCEIPSDGKGPHPVSNALNLNCRVLGLLPHESVFNRQIMIC